jgi:hypothetical protein
MKPRDKIHPTDPFRPRYSDGFVGAYWIAREEHALFLRCEGMTYERIAKQLGISRGNVEIKIRRASYALNAACKNARLQIMARK